MSGENMVENAFDEKSQVNEKNTNCAKRQCVIHRDGVRMNYAAMRRELHIKKKLQKK